MGRFDDFRIDLKGMTEQSLQKEYDLDTPFFINIDGSEFQKGKIHTVVTVEKGAGTYNLTFASKGTVVVPCDRCLDDMDIEVETESRLAVKLGRDYAEEGETVVIPEDDGVINIAWYIYEFVALALPMRHIHAPGKCNKEMVGKLKQHMKRTGDTDEEGLGLDDDPQTDDSPAGEECDPRWDELKKIIDIDDN